MKKWVLIEWRKDGDEFENVLNAETREEALASAKIKWAKLSRYDQKQRLDFYVALVKLDEDGCADLDSEADRISMEEITHTEEHPRFVEG